MNTPTSYFYQWKDCTTTAGTDTGVPVAGGGASNIMTPPTTASCSNATGTGATTSTYTIGAGDVGKALAVNVTATNGGGSTSTTTGGSCNTGLMTTVWSASTNLGQLPRSSTSFDNGQAGCSPISAVVGSAQYGSGTAGEHFCTNAPVTCGFADISNTGVPAGNGLYAVPGTCTSPSGPGAGCANTGTGWSYSNGRITFTSGAVLQNVSWNAGTDVNNLISVGNTSNVTVQDSDISGGCNCNFQTANGIITIGSASNVTIRNNNIHGLDATTAGHGCNAGIFGGSTGTGVVITNNNIYFCATGLNQIKASNGGWVIANNYIHDFAWGDSAKTNHFDGIQFEGGGSSSGLTYFVNNTDVMDAGQTSPVIISNDFAPPPQNSYRWIAHNLLAGGDVSIYVTGQANAPTLNSMFEDNSFSQIYMGDHNTRSKFGSGTFGPNAFWTPSTNTWTGNYWDDTGGTVNPDTCTTSCP